MYIYTCAVCLALGFTQQEGMKRGDRGRIPGGSSEGEARDEGAGGDDVEAGDEGAGGDKGDGAAARARAEDEDDTDCRIKDEGKAEATHAGERGLGRGWPDRG